MKNPTSVQLKPLLLPIVLEKVALGGYKIDFIGPEGASAFLCVGSPAARVDLGRVHAGHNLPLAGNELQTLRALLKVIRQLGAWGKKLDCWIEFENNGTAAGSTDHQSLDAPVEPLEGLVTTRLIASQKQKLNYSPKNAKGLHDGRVLTPFYLDGYRYFTHAYKFETVDAHRSFDCTTFPLALAFLELVKQPGYGKQVGEQLFAMQCGLEQLKPSRMFTLWDEPGMSTGSFIAFSSTHVVLVCNGVTHEFTDHAPAGYQTFKGSERERWNATNLWWVRQLPPSFDVLLA